MTRAITGQPLDPSDLGQGVTADQFEFATTQDLETLDAWPGQNRALEAIRLAAEIQHSDFNLFVLGNPGSGRHSAARSVLEQVAQSRSTPFDWVYVNNFQNPQRPMKLQVPAGSAIRLKRSIERLIDDLANDIVAIFESDDYQSRRRTIEENYSEEQESAMNALADKARKKDVAILRTPMGFGVARLMDGEIVTPDKYQELSSDEKERTDSAVAEIEAELEAVLKQVPRKMKAQRKDVEALNVRMAEEGVDAALSGVLAEFSELEKVTEFLHALRADLIENAELFLVHEDGAQAGAFPVATSKHYAKPQFQRYAVNVIVSHPDGDEEKAPVIEETLPTLQNLIGRIEYVSDRGALVTNFTMIRPGALHRSNGGYLILDARQLLIEAFAWDALKRCLETREIKIYSAGERLGLISTQTLEPDPIPLSVRVVLIGDRFLYYLLVALDPDFSRLFKLEADFDDRMPRSAESAALFGRLVGTIARKAGLRPVRADGVSRLLLESTRLADDAERFSLNLGKLSDLLREADHCARLAGAEAVRAADVEAAISASDRRTGRIRDLSQEMIERGTVLIDTDGSRTGQINALSVSQIGETRFGRPSRITVRIRVGSGKLVDIERETELGGPLHSKGVMILSGYLAGQYAQELPMSLWASIVFEQSYGGVDGDSASAAELFALLSALSDLPVDQSFAVTGSVNQFGDIQAIGGVNEKIEGFFDVCAQRGLTGQQGVLIPASNVKHLVLRPRVIEAVRDGKFRIFPIETVDQGMTLLTGRDAGERDTEGHFPPQSVNGLAESRLRNFAQTRRRFAARSDEKGTLG